MFGLRLKQLREQKNMLQKDLAEILNNTQQTISLYESGKREPDYETLKNIASYFNVSIDYLLGHTDDPSPHPKINTIAAHRTDDIMSELPPEARKSVEEFIHYVYQKYKGKND